MITKCKGCCDFLQKYFSPRAGNFFGEAKKMFNKMLYKKFKQKVSEYKKEQFLFAKFIDLLSKDKCKKYLKVNIIISHC